MFSVHIVFLDSCILKLKYFLYSSHLSFSFAFFVHGESTVCASVDVRQHPPVRNLVRTHLQQAQACLHSGPGVQGLEILIFIIRLFFKQLSYVLYDCKLVLFV